MNRYLDGRTLDDIAIERIRYFEPEAVQMNPAGYWLAFSGGKDSVVILDLAKRAGVKFAAHYSLTTCDPPELVRFVKTFPEVEIRKPRLTMWQLIREHGMMPRRAARFCCEELKETGGDGMMVITGIRAAESSRRSKRKIVEACYRNGRTRYLNPILDWATSAVWHYIRERSLRYCCLYDEGFKRIGCVLCPMTRDVERQIARWPAIARAYRSANDAIFDPAKKGRHAFPSADAAWLWWLDRDAPAFNDDPVLFEDDPALVDVEAGK